MTKVLIASDSQHVIDDVRAVLGQQDLDVREVHSGTEVSAAVAQDRPDLVVLDLQIGTMGGMAVCLDLRLEESGGRLPHVPVLMLLDRRADVFLAQRSDAESWVVKPLDPLRLRRAIEQTLAGERFRDESYKPVSIA